MFKRSLRWLMPLIVLLVVATCLAFSPVIHSHAAPITPAHNITAPDLFWNH